MTPTISVGDVVLSKQLTVGDLRPGDVADLPTSDADGNTTLTHRIVRLTPTADGQIQVDTQGDANSTGESTTLAPDTPVGRVAWTIPAIGAPATAIRTSGMQLVLGLVALALVVGALLRRSGRSTTGFHEDPATRGSAVPERRDGLPGSRGSAPAGRPSHG
jgi:signal peptidase